MNSRAGQIFLLVAMALLLSGAVFFLTGETTETVPVEAPQRVDESSEAEGPGEILDHPPSAVGDIDNP